jgi:hypothetical protein
VLEEYAKAAAGSLHDPDNRLPGILFGACGGLGGR